MADPVNGGARVTAAAAHGTAEEPSFSRKSIELIAPAVHRRYVARIAQGLAHRGHLVRTVLRPSAHTPATIDWLLYFERLAYRSRPESFEPAPVALSHAPGEPCDLVIDLAGDAPDSAVPTLRLIFETGPGETGLLSALLAMQAPALAIVATETGSVPRNVRRACLAVERQGALGTALDVVTPRLTTLLEQAVDDLDHPSGLQDATLRAFVPPRATPLVFAAHSLSRRIGERLSSLLRQPDCWRIAVRHIEGQGVMERLDWSGPQWRIVPDDHRRYFADPFIFESEGQNWLFCEEFPYATGKGILSVATIDDSGAVGALRPILETDVHLSWPQVFRHNGSIYMIPESAAAGRIELWRASEFPWKWELDRVLIDGVHAHDPVLHLSDQGAFMLATVNDDGGSSWDALGLFHATDLFGTWQAHPHNPLLVDASCVRGAGPIVERGGEMWRATQDCRTGYGDGLALCRVTQLDTGGYVQDVAVRLGAPPGLGATGSHSLSRCGSLEAIDLRGSERAPPPSLTRTA